MCAPFAYYIFWNFFFESEIRCFKISDVRLPLSLYVVIFRLAVVVSLFDSKFIVRVRHVTMW